MFSLCAYYRKCIFVLVLFTTLSTVHGSALFSVLESFTPTLNIPNYQLYEVHRALAILSEQWNNAYQASEGAETECQHVFCNHRLDDAGFVSTESFILAWNSNKASSWTTEQLCDWLGTVSDLREYRILFSNYKFTGAMLPSLLIPERNHPIKDQLSIDDRRIIEQRIIELIIYGPSDVVSSLRLIRLSTYCICTIVCTIFFMIRLYALSRQTHHARVRALKQYESRWLELQLKIFSLEDKMPSIPLKSSSKPHRFPVGVPKSRRSSSVSEASHSATGLMQQILNMTISAEQAYLMDALYNAKSLLEYSELQLADRRLWYLFVTNRPELHLTFEKCERSLSKLNEFFSELTNRWLYMHEAIDILATLNDCQWQMESSFHTDVETDLSVSRLSQSHSHLELDHAILSAEPAVSEISRSNMIMKASCTPSSDALPSIEPETLEDSNFADENQPISAVKPNGIENTETKIPRPSRIPGPILTPSFQLMNPPANKLATTLTTPSHIPLGSLKQPVSGCGKTNPIKCLPGPSPTVVHQSSFDLQLSSRNHSVRIPGFMHGGTVRMDENADHAFS